MTVALEQSREAFDRQALGDAYELLRAADDVSPLTVDDLERLAVASHLSGHSDAMADSWVRADHECVRLGDPRRAALCAFWLGMDLLLRGEDAQGGGWLARAARLVDDAPADCVERGYLLVSSGLERLRSGDGQGAHEVFCEVGDIAASCGDAT